MNLGRVLNAGGVAIATFLTGLATYKGFSELSLDALYQPLIQALLMGLAALGIGPAAAWATKGRGGNGTGPVKVGLVLLAVALAASSCSALGYQPSTVSFDRNALLLQYADLRESYGSVKVLVAASCREKPDDGLCQQLMSLHAKVVAADTQFRAAIVANKPDLTQVNLGELARLIPQLASLAALAPK